MSLPRDEDHAYRKISMLASSAKHPPSELPPPDLSHSQVRRYLSHSKHEAPTFTKENKHELFTLPGIHGQRTLPGL